MKASFDINLGISVLQDDVDWIKLNSDATNYTLQLKPNQNYANYRFGLSVESEMPLTVQNRDRRSINTVTVSTGIKWNYCTHIAGKGE